MLLSFSNVLTILIIASSSNITSGFAIKRISQFSSSTKYFNPTLFPAEYPEFIVFFIYFIFELENTLSKLSFELLSTTHILSILLNSLILFTKFLVNSNEL